MFKQKSAKLSLIFSSVMSVFVLLFSPTPVFATIEGYCSLTSASTDIYGDENGNATINMTVTGFNNNGDGKGVRVALVKPDGSPITINKIIYNNQDQSIIVNHGAWYNDSAISDNSRKVLTDTPLIYSENLVNNSKDIQVQVADGQWIGSPTTYSSYGLFAYCDVSYSQTDPKKFSAGPFGSYATWLSYNPSAYDFHDATKTYSASNGVTNTPGSPYQGVSGTRDGSDYRAYAYDARCTTCISWEPFVSGDSTKFANGFKYFTIHPPPTLSLSISNSGPAGFTSSTKSSGNQSTQGGAGWYNPMTITLNTDITGTYSSYVAFYGGASATKANFLTNDSSSIPSRIKADPTSSFLLRYDSSGTYYVWDPSVSSGTGCITSKGCFVDISSNTRGGYLICGTNIQGVKDCASKPLYTVFPESSSNKWKIIFDKNFGTKTVFTAGYVLKNNDPNTGTFNANLTPQ